MSWAELPPEIRLYVIHHLGREDLKQVRLTSKADSESSTPELFKTVHLSPNTRSFDRARALAATQRLSCHIRSVIYHDGHLTMINYKDFECFVNSFNGYNRKGTKEGWTMEVARSIHRCFVEEMDSQRDFQTRDEGKELKELCRHFTALNSITAVPDPEAYNASGFIARRTGVEPEGLFSCGRHFAKLLGAAAGIPLTTINASSASWKDMVKISQELLPTLNLKNLDRLVLSLANYEFADVQTPLHVKSFDALIGASVTSRDYTLELDCKDLAYGAIREQTQGISKAMFKYHWPKLKKLTLRGMCAMQEDLQAFLDKHSTTLKWLHLGDIQLLTQPILGPDEDAEVQGCDSIGSVVLLFQWIHRNLSLESAVIRGGWTNCHDETWSVSVSAHSGGIRRDIELWLMHQGPCPIPPELLKDRDGKRLSQSVAEQWSDESWEWDTSIRYYDPWA